MSHRVLRTVVSAVRKRIDAEAADWEPIEKKGMPVEIRSNKGEETVRAFLNRSFSNVHIRLVFDVEGMPGYKDFLYYVW